MTADRPATEPRTEAGRALLMGDPIAGGSYRIPHLDTCIWWKVGGWCDGDCGVLPAILAIEAEAAQGAASPAALDVPPEAIEWARELVRQGYRDEHVVTFTEDGYGLEHPIRCRPNLTGCVLNEWLRTQMAPDREPGRYVMEWAEDGPKYTEAER